MSDLKILIPFVKEHGEISVYDVVRLTNTGSPYTYLKMMVDRDLIRIDKEDKRTSSTGKTYHPYKLIKKQTELPL